MELLRRALAPWYARQDAKAERDLQDWYEACQVVLKTSIQALQDPQLPRGDIGVPLDRIDRALFRLRDSGLGAQRGLRQGDPELGARMRLLSEAIVDLRNDAVRFLIRAQGATPPFLAGEVDRSRQAEAYQRAMRDVGQAALLDSGVIERDLRRLWADLQPTLLRLGGRSTQT